MILEKANVRDFTPIIKFLIKNEKKCVKLVSFVRKSLENVYVIKNLNKIFGVIFIKTAIFHCFDETFFNEEENEIIKIQNELKAILTQKKIKNLCGEIKGNGFIKEIFLEQNKNPVFTNFYHLMELEDFTDFQIELANDDKIIRCSLNDKENLFSLQKSYTLEEVCIPTRKTEDDSIQLELEEILKNQLCLALISDDEFVAKINTNAIGINYVQLGGVFTKLNYRRNGYAFALVNEISKRINNSRKKVCLFVNCKNFSAISLYEKIGFKQFTEYQILYY